MFAGLWVDDADKMPDYLADSGWTQARSIWEALIKLELIPFDKVSINCKMISKVGFNDITTCDMMQWLNERGIKGEHLPSEIIVHESCAACHNYNCDSCPASNEYQRIELIKVG